MLYRTYWGIHKHLPRPFRFTTGEAILQEITACIKGVILANNVNKHEKDQCILAGKYVERTRASLVVIRGMLTIGWGMAFIAHGSFMQVTQRLDTVEKQVTRWQQWFMSRATMCQSAAVG